MDLERINLSSIKKESVRAIFQAITRMDRISRAEITNLTGLSLMTVGKVIDALLERNVIIQSKETKNAAGRKAGLVSLNREKFFLLLDLTSRNASMIVMDIALHIVDKISCEYNHEFYYEENLYFFLKNVKIYILRHLDMQNAIGVGVLLPGIYREKEDLVDSVLIPEMGKTHVKSVIEDVLKCPVDALEKDVLMAAQSNLSELEQGGDMSAAYVYLGETVSGALIFRGELLHSRSGYAGDIGQFRTENGETLQALISERGIREETVKLLAEGLSQEILLVDPDILLLENCTGSKFGTFETLLRGEISRKTGLPAEKLPEIRILETGVRHAYRGLAIKMRQDWIQKEID